MTLLEDLEYRGLIHQATNRDQLAAALAAGPITLYGGFDPTSDSLHIGNLLPILCLRRFQRAGHHPIALVGGATGLIGDPSGRTTERSLNTMEIVVDWSNKIRQQLSRFLDFEDAKNPAVLVNNYDWTEDMSVIDFLRDVGKHFSLNYMLAKDSVDSRLERGISFTEFSYMILQAYDFWSLFRRYGCTLQLGGSDQWGNITAGLEFIRKAEGQEVLGLTVPLVVKADGTKFGKTAGGAVWLDREKTSPYQFYQFWLNTDDKDVVQYLKYFTFLEQTEIEALTAQVLTNPGARAAQHTLAAEVTTLVHGRDATVEAERISQALFSGEIRALTAQEIADGFNDVPFATFAMDAAITLVDLLVEVGACTSKRQAREDIQNGAISVNGEKCTALDAAIGADDKIGGTFVVIRRGKKNYFLARFRA